MFGAPHPLKVRGLRQPTFPGTYMFALTTLFYRFVTLDIMVSGSRFLIQQFLMRLLGCTGRRWIKKLPFGAEGLDC